MITWTFEGPAGGQAWQDTYRDSWTWTYLTRVADLTIDEPAASAALHRVAAVPLRWHLTEPLPAGEGFGVWVVQQDEPWGWFGGWFPPTEEGRTDYELELDLTAIDLPPLSVYSGPYAIVLYCRHDPQVSTWWGQQQRIDLTMLSPVVLRPALVDLT